MKAKAYGRTSAAIRMNYRLAAMGDRYTREHWPGDAFVSQVRSAARAIGYVVPHTARRARRRK